MKKYLVGVLVLFLFSCGGDDNDTDDSTVVIEAEVTVSFSQSTGFDSEGNGGSLPLLSVNGTVERPSSVTVSLDPANTTASEGTDFTFESAQTINIPIGSYDGTSNTAIPIAGLTVIDDLEEENSEFFELTLSDPTGDVVLGSQISTAYTIIDNDGLTISFSQQNASGRESVGGNLPSILVIGTVLEDLSITVEISDMGTAVVGEDYLFSSPQAITIPAGTYDGSLQTALSIPGLSIIDDQLVEPSEFFELQLVSDDSDLLGISLTRYEIMGFVPCENGSADNYPCNGYDLIGRIGLTDFEAGRGNDIWGWRDDSSGREFAVVGLDNGTAFVEVSGDEPIYLGKLPTATSSSTWRDVKVFGDYAYIVSEAPGHGMQVFDLRRLLSVANPPQNFSDNGRYTNIGNAHNVVINENTAFAYPVGTARGDAFNGGVHFVDIQNPNSPVGVGGYGTNGYTHDAQVVTYNGPDSDYTGREIFIGSNEDQIAIVDITNKSNPVEISTLDYSQLGYTHQGWFTEDQRYFLLGDELDEVNFGFNSRTLVFDFTDLDSPVLHTTYLGPTGAIDHNGYVMGDEFYLANYTAGIRVLDISDIENRNITEVGFFDSFPGSDVASFDGVWSVYPYLPSGKILVNDINSGLFVIRKSE